MTPYGPFPYKSEWKSRGQEASDAASQRCAQYEGLVSSGLVCSGFGATEHLGPTLPARAPILVPFTRF